MSAPTMEVPATGVAPEILGNLMDALRALPENLDLNILGKLHRIAHDEELGANTGPIAFNTVEMPTIKPEDATLFDIKIDEAWIAVDPNWFERALGGLATGRQVGPSFVRKDSRRGRRAARNELRRAKS